MDPHCAGRDRAVRVLQVANLSGAAEQSALLDDCVVWHVDLFALLRMVGVHKLLQRRVLQPMEPSDVFHGNYSTSMRLVGFC